MGVNLHYLANWKDVLKVAEDSQQFNQTTIQEVRNFLDNPVSWSQKNGGRGN
jgi:orotate phosphoribosyltransferase